MIMICDRESKEDSVVIWIYLIHFSIPFLLFFETVLNKEAQAEKVVTANFPSVIFVNKPFHNPIIIITNLFYLAAQTQKLSLLLRIIFDQSFANGYTFSDGAFLEVLNRRFH